MVATWAGATLSLDALADTLEIGHWAMPDFRSDCAYTAYQSWLIVWDDNVDTDHGKVRAA
jgi:hypothetical protein